MVEAALARGARRFVHTSSISVYGLQTGVIDERAEQLGRVSPLNYQRSKFLAEEEVRKGIARGLDAVILNPAAIMGPYDTVNWVRMIRLVCDGRLPRRAAGSDEFLPRGRSGARACRRSGTGTPRRELLAGRH